jgi:hypothetical protein
MAAKDPQQRAAISRKGGLARAAKLTGTQKTEHIRRMHIAASVNRVREAALDGTLTQDQYATLKNLFGPTEPVNS